MMAGFSAIGLDLKMPLIFQNSEGHSFSAYDSKPSQNIAVAK